VVIEMKWYDDMDYLDDVELALAAAGLERAAEIDGQLVYLLDG
jgi:hypothetical protein